MNNLLRTLTESSIKSSLPEPELKLLLATVKESRRNINDPKVSDPFYDALEDLLHDLRTVTVDNRDAEPFLKPVSKAEAPDYYDVIPNPMDLQTMLKKVKQKQYKSKKEFKDDLDLIWSNCFTYNAAENHPLRGCATRLKAKAERLLKNITDRKERLDPVIPPVLGSNPKVNGFQHTFRPRSPISPPQVVAPKKPSPGPVKIIVPARQPGEKVPFPDSYTIDRTPEGMALFKHLDEQLEHGDHAYVTEKLREVIGGIVSPPPPPAEQWTSDGDVGDKRKVNGLVDPRPRKRTRIQSQIPLEQEREALDLWWLAVQSPAFLANGFPTLIRTSSGNLDNWRSRSNEADGLPTVRKKTKKKKKPDEGPKMNSTLYLINSNIRTIKRVRTAHAKLAALNSQQQAQSEEGGAQPPEPPDLSAVAADIDDKVDERPWRPVAAGIDMGEELADDCLRWMGSKILEHAGFQGTSKAALDVLAGVASEYLQNVGRTLRFLVDRYSGNMTAEEIILHTLFESGTTKIQDLERYVKDDIIRYGSRLGELEKKLVNAYSEAATDEALDDDALFAHEDDEHEDSAFVMGNFADALGDDFLGLKELGIADEFGLSSLSIPKKLLKGKSKADQRLSAAAKPAEPPPPFPPPPPLLPLDANSMEDQIGLLKPYYQQRFSALAATTAGSSLGFAVSQPALSDDVPQPSHTKIGPIGQIMKPAASSSVKKKPKSAQTPAVAAPAAPAKVNPNTNGNGRPLAPATAPATPAPVPAPDMPPPPPVKKNPVGRPRKKKLPDGAMPDMMIPNPNSNPLS
ncbi:hypothetical protein NEOLEDRAFT_1097621 [Neolentinus lepideus HHB14362 ss-1]|uniref:Bromo domain-containing protein n=1 Tax=Neolentinus lepideus HHB14362 ss-1 TaxID=1314782 RepID=A0A165QI08_9AGAM|nr:hypothetical protein NEOLEDRAFT_1097621 [Neolentinus lepideus HHB14362 ss-1]